MATPRVPRDERLSPGTCLLIVVAGCLIFLAWLTALIWWSVPFVRWLFQ